MTHHTIIDRFLEYEEGRLAADTKEEIERHLAGCASCAAAYGLFRRALTPGTEQVRALTADPFLPTRIRAIAKEQHRRIRWMRAVRVSFASLALAVALASGIYLGKGISAATTTSSTDIASELASSISASDLGDQWI